MTQILVWLVLGTSPTKLMPSFHKKKKMSVKNHLKPPVRFLAANTRQSLATECITIVEHLAAED